MFTEAEEALKERFSDINGPDLAFLLSSLAIAHISNYVHTVIPHCKPALLQISAALCDLEIELRNMKEKKENDLSPKQEESKDNPAPFTIIRSDGTEHRGEK